MQEMLDQKTIEKILGITPPVDLDAKSMASQLILTVFPSSKSLPSKEVLDFFSSLQETLKRLGVKIIPYNQALETVPFSKVLKRFFKIIVNNLLFVICYIFSIDSSYYHIHPGAFLNLLKRRRIKKGISVIVLGENSTSKLPIDFTSSFTRNSIITILDCPNGINENTKFSDHFDLAMNIFSYHMTHIAILVDSEKWIVYNFNASHPIYSTKKDLEKNVLEALIPKIAAPIQPPLLKDFLVRKGAFDINGESFPEIVNDFIVGGTLFQKTELYPSGKKVNELPFRSGFYRWIGKIHLDHRSGMSYGFLARQLPSKCLLLEQTADHNEKSCFFIENGEYHITFAFRGSRYSLRVPPVWVLTQRSGSNKTKIDPKKDLILLGLKDGKYYLYTSQGSKLNRDYKPSFDTKVILAHALGNSIIASVLNFLGRKEGISLEFPSQFETSGLALAHWHGYFEKTQIPHGWMVYGRQNPHVACSTNQSAIFALKGKLDSFISLDTPENYKGDVHIEPHHGINITFSSISELAQFLLSHPNATQLGNKYLD